jgi:vitamin B12 transporter
LLKFSGIQLLIFILITALLGAKPTLPAQAEEEGVALAEVALEPSDFEADPVLSNEVESGNTPAGNPSLSPLSNPATAPLLLQTTKIAIPSNQTGSAASVITRQQIQQMQPFSLTEVLRQVPGVDVVQNGYLGGTSSIFIRGMNAGHTLVLVNGVRLNDPIAPDRTFSYLDQISPDSVERIEVLRGPQSTLYGSDSMGGVVNIITRQGEPGKPTLYAKLTAGSQGTLQQDIALGSQYRDKLKSFLHVTRQDVRGISAASNRYGITSFGTAYNNAERDGYHNTTITARTEYTPTQNLSLDVATLFTRARFDLDSFGGYRGDDPNFTGANRTFTLNGGSRLQLFEGRYEQVTRLAYSDIRRENFNEPDVLNSGKSHDRYRGKLLNFDFQNNFYLHRTNTLTAGLNVQHEWGDSYFRSLSIFGPFNSEAQLRSATNTAFYVQDRISLWDRWFTTLGYRMDHHNRFGNHHNFRADSIYTVKQTGTRLKGSFGTGFKAPTLSQLYGAFGANPNLRPETSTGWDVGIEQPLIENKIQVGATVFQNQVRNLIDFRSQGFATFYTNVEQARMQGIETYIASQPFQCLQIRSTYTYTDTKDLGPSTTQGDPLLRRPRNKASLNINYQPVKRLNVNLDITHTGQRSDLDFFSFPAQEVKLKAFTLINLAVTLALSDHVSLYGRVVNFLDTPYETVKGYGNPRISAYGGLKMAL